MRDVQCVPQNFAEVCQTIRSRGCAERYAKDVQDKVETHRCTLLAALQVGSSHLEDGLSKRSDEKSAAGRSQRTLKTTATRDLYLDDAAADDNSTEGSEEDIAEVFRFAMGVLAAPFGDENLHDLRSRRETGPAEPLEISNPALTAGVVAAPQQRSLVPPLSSLDSGGSSLGVDGDKSNRRASSGDRGVAQSNVGGPSGRTERAPFAFLRRQLCAADRHPCAADRQPSAGSSQATGSSNFVSCRDPNEQLNRQTTASCVSVKSWQEPSNDGEILVSARSNGSVLRDIAIDSALSVASDPAARAVAESMAADVHSPFHISVAGSQEFGLRFGLKNRQDVPNGKPTTPPGTSHRERSERGEELPSSTMSANARPSAQAALKALPSTFEAEGVAPAMDVVQIVNLRDLKQHDLSLLDGREQASRISESKVFAFAGSTGKIDDAMQSRVPASGEIRVETAEGGACFDARHVRPPEHEVSNASKAHQVAQNIMASGIIGGGDDASIVMASEDTESIIHAEVPAPQMRSAMFSDLSTVTVIRASLQMEEHGPQRENQSANALVQDPSSAPVAVGSNSNAGAAPAIASNSRVGLDGLSDASAEHDVQALGSSILQTVPGSGVHGALRNHWTDAGHPAVGVHKSAKVAEDAAATSPCVHTGRADVHGNGAGAGHPAAGVHDGKADVHGSHPVGKLRSAEAAEDVRSQPASVSSSSAALVSAPCVFETKSANPVGGAHNDAGLVEEVGATRAGHGSGSATYHESASTVNLAPADNLLSACSQSAAVNNAPADNLLQPALSESAGGMGTFQAKTCNATADLLSVPHHHVNSVGSEAAVANFTQARPVDSTTHIADLLSVPHHHSNSVGSEAAVGNSTQARPVDSAAHIGAGLPMASTRNPALDSNLRTSLAAGFAGAELHGLLDVTFEGTSNDGMGMDGQPLDITFGMDGHAASDASRDKISLQARSRRVDSASLAHAARIQAGSFGAHDEKAGVKTLLDSAEIRAAVQDALVQHTNEVQFERQISADTSAKSASAASKDFGDEFSFDPSGLRTNVGIRDFPTHHKPMTGTFETSKPTAEQADGSAISSPVVVSHQEPMMHGSGAGGKKAFADSSAEASAIADCIQKLESERHASISQPRHSDKLESERHANISQPRHSDKLESERHASISQPRHSAPGKLRYIAGGSSTSTPKASGKASTLTFLGCADEGTTQEHSSSRMERPSADGTQVPLNSSCSSGSANAGLVRGTASRRDQLSTHGRGESPDSATLPRHSAKHLRSPARLARRPSLQTSGSASSQPQLCPEIRIDTSDSDREVSEAVHNACDVIMDYEMIGLHRQESMNSVKKSRPLLDVTSPLPQSSGRRPRDMARRPTDEGVKAAAPRRRARSSDGDLVRAKWRVLSPLAMMETPEQPRLSAGLRGFGIGSVTPKSKAPLSPKELDMLPKGKGPSQPTESPPKSCGVPPSQPGEAGKGASAASQQKGSPPKKGVPPPPKGKGGPEKPNDKGSAGPKKGAPPPKKGAPPGKGGTAPGKGPSTAEEPRKPDVKPGVQVKKLYWSSFRLDRSGTKTVWNEIDAEGSNIDFDELEALFKEDHSKHGDAASAKAAGESGSGRPRNPTPDVPKVNKVQVLDAQRRRQICVMLPRLPDKQRLYDALMDMDTSHLNRDQVELLLLNIPSQEEVKLLANAQREHTFNEFNIWDIAEDFIITLMSIPQFQLRLQIWEFENSFPERAQAINQAEETLARACDTLLSSSSIKHLLGIALYAGNFLNGGTARGRADGFAIDTLAQMKTVKMTQADRPGTLVDYIVRQMEKKYPGELAEVCAPGQAGENLKSASRVKLGDILDEIKSLITRASSMIKMVKPEGDAAKDDAKDDVKGGGLAKHGDTLSMHLANLKEVQQRLLDVQGRYQELCVWFHVDKAAKKDTQDFFGIWGEFVSDIGNAFKALQEQEKQESMRRARAELSSSLRPTMRRHATVPCFGDTPGRPREMPGGRTSEGSGSGVRSSRRPAGAEAKRRSMTPRRSMQRLNSLKSEQDSSVARVERPRSMT